MKFLQYKLITFSIALLCTIHARYFKHMYTITILQLWKYIEKSVLFYSLIALSQAKL